MFAVTAYKIHNASNKIMIVGISDTDHPQPLGYCKTLSEANKAVDKINAGLKNGFDYAGMIFPNESMSGEILKKLAAI